MNKQAFFENFFNSFSQTGPVSGYHIECEVFMNPTSRELRDAGAECRGYLSPRGDLYVASRPSAASSGSFAKRRKAGEIIHADLLELLGSKVVPARLTQNEGEFSELLDMVTALGICVMRVGNSPSFICAESYMDEDIEENHAEIEALFAKASQKNPSLTFEVAGVDMQTFAG